MKLRKKSIMIMSMMVAVTLVIGALSMCINSKAESVTDNHSVNINANSEQLKNALNVATELSNKMANTEVNELKNEKDVKLYTKKEGYKLEKTITSSNGVIIKCGIIDEAVSVTRGNIKDEKWEFTHNNTYIEEEKEYGDRKYKTYSEVQVGPYTLAGGLELNYEVSDSGIKVLYVEQYSENENYPHYDYNAKIIQKEASNVGESIQVSNLSDMCHASSGVKHVAEITTLATVTIKEWDKDNKKMKLLQTSLADVNDYFK